MMAHEFNPGGLVPANGLRVSHAERVFQEAGTFPVHVARKKLSPDPSFYRQLLAYVESGFPLFASMHNRGHAIAIVGYEWCLSAPTTITGMGYAWDQVQAIAVVDDNYLPYLSVQAKSVGSVSTYSGDDIDAFIVALPEKVFYPADAIESLAPALFKLGTVVGLPNIDETIIRYFITTGSALRNFVRGKESEFDPQLVTTIMKLPFAQFVWIVEFATASQWDLGQVAARAVIDATASLREAMPLWLLHSRTDALVFDRQEVGLNATLKGMGTFHFSTPAAGGFTRMETNLRPTRTK
jgi:hypothetical protein